MSQEKINEPKWYVVHTYSGYENKVKTDLEKTIKNRELEDYFSKNDSNRRIMVYSKKY